MAFEISLSLAEGTSAVSPLLTFILGISLYSLFIFKFYRLVAKRDIFGLNLVKYAKGSKAKGFALNVLKVGLYIIQNIIIFPAIIIVWFSFFSVLIALLSETATIRTIFIMAISIVASVRIAAYYNEDLSRDLAKMLPFVLLGVFIVDYNFINVAAAIERMIEIPANLTTIIYYTGFVALLELVLRITAFAYYFVKIKVLRVKPKKEEDTTEKSKRLIEKVVKDL